MVIIEHDRAAFATPGAGVPLDPPIDPAAVSTTRLVIPGGGTLEFVRDPISGALTAVTGNGTTYLTVDRTGTRNWWGICSIREQRLDHAMIRHVTAGDRSWREDYRWQGHDLIEVDGVIVRRDAQRRVIACLPGGHDPADPQHRWFYSYDDIGLAHVSGPFGSRTIASSDDGRVRSANENGVMTRIEYDEAGVRRGPGRPVHDHVDDAGRCWATLDASGAVEYVYIWDGIRCLARIDGPVGAPLTQVYSLDPSGTPVRVITTDGDVRIPRDAFGDGLLAERSVPGLFGGRIHGGLVHLPLRRLDPRVGSFCEPDPCIGGDDDPRRLGVHDGPVPVEPDPRSLYEVCRGDPVGRADPTGGVSAGLIISDLTWSFQNNMMSFFGIDWWFNLFASLIVKPFSGIGNGIDYEFFSSTGLVASPRHGSFGVRRGGIINAITGGRAFTTQHIVWSPDDEYAELEHGEVIDPGGEFVPTHYGTILSATPAGHGAGLLSSMVPVNRAWLGINGPTTRLAPDGTPERHPDGGAVVDNVNGLLDWTRHGGIGVPVAPGTLTPRFPGGGLHLDNPMTDTRHDIDCTMRELRAGAVATGDLEDRTFLTASSPTGLGAGDEAVIVDSTPQAVAQIATVVAVVPVGGAERIQLDRELTALAARGLSMTKVTPASGTPESHAAGAVPDSLEVGGTAATYAIADRLQVSSSATPPLETVVHVERLEARLPLDRPLPSGFGGPIDVAIGVVSPVTFPVTVVASAAGEGIDFGTAARPAVGTTGVVSGAGVDVAVRIETHVDATVATLDLVLPAAVATAPSVTFRAATSGPVLGRRNDTAEPAAEVSYEPVVAGAAPDGSGGLLVVRCVSAGVAHLRIVPGPAAHDVIVLDRAIAGTGPFLAERFVTVGSTATMLSRAEVMALVVDDPGRFSAAPAVFLTKVTGEPPIPSGAAALIGVDVTAGRTTATPAAAVVGLEPGRPVMVGTRTAVLRTVRVTATFADPLDLYGDPLRVVGLQATGHSYLGEATATAEVLVRPSIDISGTSVDVPFARFVIGDVVAITSGTAASTVTSWHRVAAANGGRLRIADGPALTPGDAVTVTHAATTDPGNGSPFLGIDGARTGSGPTTTATFSVWASNALDPVSVGPIGIVDGDTTHPATIDAVAQPVELTFSEEFDATGVDIATLATHTDDRFVTTLVRDGGVLLLEGSVGALATAPGESLIAVSYEGVGPTTVATIGPGTLLVPEGEATEVDRSQSLTDHELTHTKQYARWGPLWFNLFPMLAIELPIILATDSELPKYSAFLDATIESGTRDRWNLTIPDTAGVTIEDDDHLQVVQGSRTSQVVVRSVSGATVEVRAADGALVPTGDVSVRKLQRDPSADKWYDPENFLNALQLLTHGGLVNVTAGSTWGGIFWLIGKAVYGLGRAISGTGELYPATVQDGGGALTLADADDVTHIRESGSIVVRQGDDTVVRTMTRSETLIVLTEGVAFTGDVQIAMYDTHEPGSAFDWYDYHSATVDPDNPFVIEVAADSGTLNLDPEDRVVIRYRDRSPSKTDVLSVNGSSVELLDPIPITSGELSLRIARVGASDPLGNADSTAMVEMGMGWMKWIFDPYGQIEYAARPDEEWSRWLLRVMRWLLGTQNFSLLPFGYLWWGRLFRESESHLTAVEQEASEESGDLYSSLGRVFGERTDDGYARYRMVVGDIARYRFWSVIRGVSFVQRGLFDAPGVSFDDRTLFTMPDRTDTGAGTAAPNFGVVAGATGPGRAVAEVFTARDPDPRLATDPIGFSRSALGAVPVSSRNQRMISNYIAFTRPGDHRVTTRNGLFLAGDAIEAQGEERQELIFDITATDVTVTVAGSVVDDSTPGTSDVVALVPFQRAEVSVTPNGTRSYRLAVPDPNGSVVRTDGDARLVGVAASPDSVPVEVSRFHGVSGQSYGSGGLAFAGMHLSRDVHIPVRRFSATVVDTLPLRDAASLAGATITTLARGDTAFLLVPAQIDSVPSVTSIAGAAPPPEMASPISRVDAPDAAAFLGTAGTAFAVTFPPTSPTGDAVITLSVGDGSTTATLTSTVTVS